MLLSILFRTFSFCLAFKSEKKTIQKTIAIKIVVSVSEILKHRGYATIKSIQTSMIEDNENRPIAKLEVTLMREKGVKERIEKIRQEQKNETVNQPFFFCFVYKKRNRIESSIHHKSNHCFKLYE